MLIVHPVRITEISITPGQKTDTNQFGIFGAVKIPGYYSADSNIRVGEAVEMAGGLTDDADPAYAHLAKWVIDGETIIIPTASPVQPTLTSIIPDNEPIDLNSAGKSELMSLPGIGEKRAEEILRLREEKGNFSSPEDILVIPGISEKLLESIYDRLIVR